MWSYVQLGKIFDVTGQRERALGEYRKALQTNDNTQGAMEEARKYLSSPYQQKAGWRVHSGPELYSQIQRQAEACRVFQKP